MNQTSGYCGADLKAFCAEAALISLRRTFPQVYESNARLKLDHSKLKLALGDFAAALRKIVPSSKRSAVSKVKPLEGIMKIVLSTQLGLIEEKVSVLFPPFRFKSLKPFTSLGCSNRNDYIFRGNDFLINSSHIQNDVWMSFLTDVSSTASSSSRNVGLACDPQIVGGEYNGSSDVGSSFLMNLSRAAGRPRMLIAGRKDMGQDQLGQATLHILESFPTYSIDITTLLGDSFVNSPEQALIQKVEEACKSSPSIIYFPNIVNW